MAMARSTRRALTASALAEISAMVARDAQAVLLLDQGLRQLFNRKPP